MAGPGTQKAAYVKLWRVSWKKWLLRDQESMSIRLSKKGLVSRTSDNSEDSPGFACRNCLRVPPHCKARCVLCRQRGGKEQGRKLWSSACPRVLTVGGRWPRLSPGTRERRSLQPRSAGTFVIWTHLLPKGQLGLLCSEGPNSSNIQT